MSTTVANDHELEVPGRFVPLFRLAVIDELASDTTHVKAQSDDVAKSYEGDERPELLGIRLDDLSNAERSLSESHRLLEQICVPSDPRRDAAIRGTYEALRGALEETMRRATKEMADAAQYSPIDGGLVVHAASAAIWAAEQTERLDAQAA